MPDISKNPFQFWQELKRRKVIRVIIGYLASAYVLLELTSIIAEPFGLPEGTIKLVFIILCAGLIIVIYLSWRYDVTPAGIKKTEPAKVARETIPIKSDKRKVKISDVVIAVLLVAVVILVYPKLFKQDRFEEIRNTDGRISIAVIPFENQTGDSTLNWFERGISSLIINGLGGSSELAVFDDHAMYEAMESTNQVFTAGIATSMAKETASKINAETYISGSYQGRGSTYWIMANLVNTESGDVIWTTKVEGDLKSSEYLTLASILCIEIRDYLEIKVLEQETDFDFREAYPNSSEAYRYYIEGMNLILTRDYLPAIESMQKALKIDPDFTFASFYIAYAYCFTTPAKMSQAKIWTQKAYDAKENLPLKYQNWLRLWHACYISKNFQDIVHYCSLLEESGIESRLFWFDLGVTYFSLLKQYEKAVSAFERIEKMSLERGSNWKYQDYYVWFGKALHAVGEHEKEKETYALGLSLFSDNNLNRKILSNQAICAASQNATTEVMEYLEEYLSIGNEIGQSSENIDAELGLIYFSADMMVEAEQYFRNALDSDPQHPYYKFLLGRTIIKGNINVEEGMDLIQQVLEIHPNWFAPLQWKGIGLYKLGKYEQSLIFLKRSEEFYNTFKFDLHKYIQEAEQALAQQSNEM